MRRNRKKDISILNSAKMVSIAEMLNNIAHQWRQPLNVISTSASGLKIHKEIDRLDDENFDILTNSILDQSKSLSKTIESFREYIHDNNDEKKLFILQTRVDKAIEFVNETFKYNQIEIVKKYEKDNLHIFANAGELIQVVLNILNNAKEVLIKNNSMDNRKIEIEIKRKNENFALISILDNAGGVPQNIIDKIFDPYFTTKHESIGTGISLYMCYEIITVNFKGKIYVKNKKEGAKFYIEIPLSKY